METIFKKENYDNIISRVQKISDNSKPLWGKMNVSQMMHHLNLAMEAPLGKLKVIGKPNFFMRIFKGVLYNDKPFGKGVPTPKDFKILENNFNFYKEKESLLSNIKEAYNKGIHETYQPHVFFGQLTSEQWGMHFYKHLDHHLRQFGV